jgi:hypothetical protein
MLIALPALLCEERCAFAGCVFELVSVMVLESHIDLANALDLR